MALHSVYENGIYGVVPVLWQHISYNSLEVWKYFDVVFKALVLKSALRLNSDTYTVWYPWIVLAIHFEVVFAQYLYFIFVAFGKD